MRRLDYGIHSSQQLSLRLGGQFSEVSANLRKIRIIIVSTYWETYVGTDVGPTSPGLQSHPMQRSDCVLYKYNKQLATGYKIKDSRDDAG